MIGEGASLRAAREADAEIKVLVFDLDGTLVPTMEDYADKAAELMAQAFGTPLAEARHAYFATSGLPFERQLRQLYPGEQTDPVADRFEAWKDGYLSGIALPAAYAKLLAHWRSQGLLIAISSQQSRNLRGPSGQRLAGGLCAGVSAHNPQ